VTERTEHRIFFVVRTPGDPMAVELEAGPEQTEAAGFAAALVVAGELTSQGHVALIYRVQCELGHDGRWTRGDGMLIHRGDP